MNTFTHNEICSSNTYHPIARHHCVENSAPTAFVVPGSRVTQIAKRIANWWNNRAAYRVDRDAFSHLLSLDDHALKDIGVTRSDVKWASQLPLSQNASLELEILARSNKGRL